VGFPWKSSRKVTKKFSSFNPKTLNGKVFHRSSIFTRNTNEVEENVTWRKEESCAGDLRVMNEK
jgi:hypothetical protein